MIATSREKLNQLQDMVFSTPLSELAIERSREDRQGKRQVLLNLKWLLSLSLAITASGEKRQNFTGPEVGGCG